MGIWNRLFALAVLLISVQAGVLAADEQKVLERTKTEWLEILATHQKPQMRKAAVIALGIFGAGDKEVLPALSKALASDKDNTVRLQAAATLGSANAQALRDALPTFADVLKDDKSAALRAAAAGLIGKLGDYAKPALTTLVKALKDGDASVRAHAVEAIGQIGPEAASAVNDIVPMLKDGDSSVRYSAVFALGRLGTDADSAIGQLLTVLEKDTSADVRREVGHTLALIGDASGNTTLPALIKALRNDKSEEVRRQLALTLGKLGNIKEQMPAILGILKSDKDRTVRIYLIRSIPAALGTAMKDHVKDFAQWLGKEPDADARLAIIQELGALGSSAKDALDALMHAESDVVLSVREAARQAIAKINEVKKN